MTLLRLTPDILNLPTPIAVLGLGVSGRALVNLLKQSNIEFAAWDDREIIRDEMNKQGIPLHNFNEDGLSEFKTLIPAAGIPPFNNIIEEAANQGVVIANDVDVLYDASRPTPIIGITGTNGKSTTTALTGHVLNSCGIECAIGGNIGLAATGLAAIESKDGVYVVELSSYQIANINHACFDIAVLLNITPDHLEWHRSLDNYIDAKKKLFLLSPKDKKQTAIIGIDNDVTYDLCQELLRQDMRIKCIPISVTHELQGSIYIKNHILVDHMGAQPEIIIETDRFPVLRGAHNHQNILATYAIAKTLGLDKSDIIDAIQSFEGLAHRQELVLKKHNHCYINDSKATNFNATEKAIKAYKNIHLILGGKPKDGGIDGIEEFTDNIKHAYLIGEASQQFATKLAEIEISFTQCKTMDKAVMSAYHNMNEHKNEEEQVMMLSPACASFDQYSNFEERGDHFKQLVRTLEALS